MKTFTNFKVVLLQLVSGNLAVCIDDEEYAIGVDTTQKEVWMGLLRGCLAFQPLYLTRQFHLDQQKS